MTAETARAPDQPGLDLGNGRLHVARTGAGKELDARTDLFSFGAVLYEMATGTLPFRGESSPVIFKAILDETPTPVRLNPDLPAEMEPILRKALEKDRSCATRARPICEPTWRG